MLRFAESEVEWLGSGLDIERSGKEGAEIRIAAGRIPALTYAY